jgi:hypothetical protein
MRPRRPVAKKATRRSLDDEIARLCDLDLQGLRARWKSMFRQQPPPHLPRHLLFAVLAYRLQVEELGDLDPVTARLLKQIATGGGTLGASRRTDAFSRRRAELKPGTILMRKCRQTKPGFFLFSREVYLVAGFFAFGWGGPQAWHSRNGSTMPLSYGPRHRESPHSRDRLPDICLINAGTSWQSVRALPKGNDCPYGKADAMQRKHHHHDVRGPSVGLWQSFETVGKQLLLRFQPTMTASCN